MPRSRTEHAFSAGGVVYRQAPGPSTIAAHANPMEAFEIVLVGRAAEGFWVLPKGTPQTGETHEQVALREVREETGISGRLMGELGRIRYWFSRRGVRYSKEVLYYLMEAAGGDVSLHDHEYDDARWFPLSAAATALAYANEAEIVRTAEARLTRGAEPGDIAKDLTL
ncbi:MAG: NUDIX hydrolase [Ktedonobacterales bacterium]